MLRLRAILASGAATAALVLSASAVPAQGATPQNSAASSGRYQQQMVHALAGSLGVSDAAAVRRLDSQARQQTALRTSGADPRGAFFDGAGRLTVNVTGAATARPVEAAGLKARIAPHSAGELASVKDALDKYAEIVTPAGVSGWGVDPASDKVVVQVRDTSAAGTAAFLRKAASFGSAVAVRHDGGRAVSTAGTVYPGSRMDYGNHYCSVGFGARTSSGQQVLVTAGHCVESLPDLYYDGSHFAKGTRTRFHHGQNSVDMGLASVDSGTAIATRIGTWNNGADVAVKGSRRAAVGSDVCKSGATSHWTCGSVKSYDYSVTYTDPGQPATLVTNLGLSNVCVLGGDSGGAWVSGDQGQGMTSGGRTDNQCDGVYGQGTSYFQPLGDTLQYYGLTLNTA
ncbi:alpha-lytic protease prodomain-containing protein [Streptomyces sp. LP11]|uniref:Alpha-lytic protease prodomain-containing protein n=1 Tax=Streptomyces pyxinicus TaxID=2970331 RepID=A0ABT2B4E2_9ACTN|nr:alpha-lytic protease prodomain-containing protein [Streptomyces sp. LP11]MCS0603387.1 alpha-lytic protease prodomain-containing protein [Streptomyces sp. LP11]